MLEIVCFRKSPLPDFENSSIVMTALRRKWGYFTFGAVTPNLCGLRSNTGYELPHGREIVSRVAL